MNTDMYYVSTFILRMMAVCVSVFVCKILDGGQRKRNRKVTKIIYRMMDSVYSSAGT